jgi:hypothetical protein
MLARRIVEVKSKIVQLYGEAIPLPRTMARAGMLLIY